MCEANTSALSEVEHPRPGANLSSACLSNCAEDLIHALNKYLLNLTYFANK